MDEEGDFEEMEGEEGDIEHRQANLSDPDELDIDIEEDEELQKVLMEDLEPIQKRSRRMHADDEEEEKETSRLVNSTINFHSVISQSFIQ